MRASWLAQAGDVAAAGEAQVAHGRGRTTSSADLGQPITFSVARGQQLAERVALDDLLVRLAVRCSLDFPRCHDL